MFGTKKTTRQHSKMIPKFAALGDPNRYKIMNILYENNDICVSEVAERIGISTAGVSQHMRILEQAGLIKKLRKGQKICYQLDEDRAENNEILRIVTSQG